MPILECDKSLIEVKAGTWVDYLHPFAVVHDEVDYLVLKHLRDPLMKRIVEITSLKDIFDKRFQWAGIATTYDVEFDDVDSWTAKKSVPIYMYTRSREEHKAKLEYQSLKKELAMVPEAPIQEPETLTIHNFTETTLSLIESLPDGNTTVMIMVNSQPKTYSRKVNVSTLPPQ